MKKGKIFLLIILCILLSFSSIPLTVFADDNNTIMANWKFDKESIKSGTIENNDLVISDLSGNGNDIYLKETMQVNTLNFPMKKCITKQTEV